MTIGDVVFLWDDRPGKNVERLLVPSTSR